MLLSVHAPSALRQRRNLLPEAIATDSVHCYGMVPRQLRRRRPYRLPRTEGRSPRSRWGLELQQGILWVLKTHYEHDRGPGPFRPVRPADGTTGPRLTVARLGLLYSALSSRC